jgi:uncharacterized membrane protein
MINYTMGPQSAPPRPMPRTAQQEQSLRNLTLVAYLLYGLSLVTGVPVLLALVLNYARLSESRGSMYHSHLRWLLRTFWWGLFWGGVGLALLLAGVASGAAGASNPYLAQDYRVFGIFSGGTALLVLFADWLWIVTRLVRGILNWNDYRGMPG